MTTTLVIAHFQRIALKAFITTALKFIFAIILHRTKTGLQGRACDSAPQTPSTGSVSGFGGQGVSMLASGTQVRGFRPAEAVGFLRAEKSSARLPSEGK
jgi:ABC-type uncharacterized transport system permease subunit